MPRRPNTLGRVFAYHGCDREIAKRLLNHEIEIDFSRNGDDWLGDGAYFWVDSLARAVDWAEDRQRDGTIQTPAVIGAFIYVGLSLNLIDIGVISDVKESYNSLLELMTSAGKAMLVNEGLRNGVYVKRYLDCAVFNHIHELRRLSERAV
jgi:hypothetical protein